MQINSYQSIQAIPPSQANPTSEPTNVTPAKAVEPGVQVSISEQAQQLAKNDSASSNAISRPPAQLPTEPQTPLTGEKLEQAVQIKKAQAQYKVASDIVNMATNGDSNMSAPTAYYLSKNEDAREVVLDTKSQQQTMKNMQAYQEQTAALNEQYA